VVIWISLSLEHLEDECGRRLTDIFEHDEWTSLVTWKEVQAASAHPLVTFGSHTVDHMRLGLATRSEIRQQVNASKASIERHTGHECRYFCFPSGSFNVTALEELETSGYAAAVTTLEGLNTRQDNPLALRRLSFPASDLRTDILSRIAPLSQLKNLFRWPGVIDRTTECVLGD
jgi:peptidoglycan/xylan/chitin deacetylase (PgdA/CDA1 family)